MRSTSFFARPLRGASLRVAVTALAVALAAACSDSPTTAPAHAPPVSRQTIAASACTADVRASTVQCAPPLPARNDISRDIIGGQNINVTLTSSNVAYHATSQIFEFDVNIKNLLNEALGTPDGALVDTAGIRVFFNLQPVATTGSGVISVINPDGVSTFTASSQPYFEYVGILGHNAVSPSKNWQLSIPPAVARFDFSVFLSATVQSLLVINEVMVNPGGTITEPSGEWFEVYNAGSRPVEMQGFLIADSAATGPQPYHAVTSFVLIPAGAYRVFGSTTNTTLSGGDAVDFAYGNTIALANGVDAIKIARVFIEANGRRDTLTIDYVHYANASISALDGISRELKNPALDNLDMDGPNWAAASVSAVYGPGGRGTRRAQNSAFTP